jgi:hypothetical protein
MGMPSPAHYPQPWQPGCFPGFVLAGYIGRAR